MLHCLTLGSGPELVMLHGWAMHGAVMQEFAERLAARFRVTLIDLPGHGQSPVIEDMSLPGMAAAVLAQAPTRAHWLGWSLGATLSMEIAHVAAWRMLSLILMAGTPRFVRDDDWPGVDEILFAQFAKDLEDDAGKLTQRFLTLQLWGLDDARRIMKKLRARLDTCEPPAAAALQAGLSILRAADLRTELAALRLPVLAVLGRRDRLVPPSVGGALRTLNPGVQVEIVAAAHLPFLTHGDDTRDVVERFLLCRDG